MQRLKYKQLILPTSSTFSVLVWTGSQMASASGVIDSDNFCPTDSAAAAAISPRQCRPTDNLDPQEGGLPPITLLLIWDGEFTTFVREASPSQITPPPPMRLRRSK